MRKFFSALLVVLAAWAQKKPVTLDALSDAPREAASRRVAWAPDGKSFAFREGGEVKIYDVASLTARTLLQISNLDSAAVKSSQDHGPFDWTNRHARTDAMEWSTDGKLLLYDAGGDLFVIHMPDGKWEQLTKTPEVETDAKLSPDGKRVAYRRGWDLYAMEIAGKKEIRLTMGGTDTLRNGVLDWVYPEELNLDTAFWWSPDSRSVAYLQFDTSREPVFPHSDLLGTRAVYEPERYPQAGEANATVRLGVVAADGGRTRWIDAARTDATALLARAGWMPDSKRLYIVRMNRVQNQLEALAIAVESGKTATLFRESDPNWVNLRGDLRFLHDGAHFLWTSERDGGYRHIYLYSNDGTDVKRLTSGDWEVTGIVGVDEIGGRVYYTSSEPTHLETHLYYIGLDGQNKRRLTEEAGTHDISMPASGTCYLDTYSSLKSPPRTVLHAGDGRMLGVYREPSERQTEYDLLTPEMVTFPGADGTQLYGKLIRPAGFQEGRKYPVVVTVYGGPDVPLPVRNQWPALDMDQVLAHHGYVVWQAENRGGYGRGHAFETSIYHNLGVNELADQVAGVRYLISLGIADPARIGIRGHSYGGFMTVNALLNAPDVFQAGFAGAPVTNWTDYDSIYTERYMGLPGENGDGYRNTALPRNAAQLKGKLMIAHNLEDDNVLFQNTLQLTNALQAAGKQFEMMLYAQKTHGITGANQRHENELMLDFFDRALGTVTP